MGYPVVHFEIVGKDGAKLNEYYGELFGWNIETDNPMNYGMVAREGNKAANGDLGIGGGVAQGPDGYEATSPSTSRFRMSRQRCRRPRAWAARA